MVPSQAQCRPTVSNWPMTAQSLPVLRSSPDNARCKGSSTGQSRLLAMIESGRRLLVAQIAASMQMVRSSQRASHAGGGRRKTCDEPWLRNCRTISLRCRSKFAYRNSIRGLTRNGGSIVIASRSGSQIHSLPVMPAFCEANWISMPRQRRPNDYSAGTTSRPSLVAVKASQRRVTFPSNGARQGRSFAASAGRSPSTLLPTLKSRLDCSNYGLSPMDFCPKWCGISLALSLRSVRDAEDRTGSTNWSPPVTAASDRLQPLLAGSASGESDLTTMRLTNGNHPRCHRRV